MKSAKIFSIVFVLSFISMLVSQLTNVSPATFKILDTIAVSGFVVIFAAATVASAKALNTADFGSDPILGSALKMIVYCSGICAGAMSLGFVTLVIIKNIHQVESISRLSFESYDWVFALLLGAIFLGLSRKILATRTRTRAC